MCFISLKIPVRNFCFSSTGIYQVAPEMGAEVRVGPHLYRPLLLQDTCDGTPLASSPRVTHRRTETWRMREDSLYVHSSLQMKCAQNTFKLRSQ